MLHRFACHAMDLLGNQFAAKSRTDNELIALCQHVWKIAILMMQTSPFAMHEVKNAAATVRAPTTPNGSAPEASES